MSGFTASMGEQHLPYVSPSNSGSHVIGAVVLGGRDPCSRAQTTGQREEKKTLSVVRWSSEIIQSRLTFVFPAVTNTGD